jgi:hypothetical protein
MRVTARIYTPYATIQRLLSPIQMTKARKADHGGGAEPSAARRAPWGFSAGAVDSLSS